MTTEETSQINREPYTDLALAYDYILRHVDYQGWYDYIKKVMHRYCPVKEPFVVELGCGTGRFGAKFSADNYEIVGIDRSVEMLRVAKSRAFKNFRIFCGDIANLAMKRRGDFIFSVHDTMNYFTTPEELAEAIASVKATMHRDSIFMFDITTAYNIEANFHEVTNCYEVRGRTVEWTNRFHYRKKEVISTLRFYNDDGTYTEENHFQRIYSVGRVKKILKKQGLEVLAIYGDYTFEAPKSDTVMINFITRIAQ